MQVIFDNIAFSLQRAGGISLYWYELIKRLRHKEDVYFFEFNNNNIFRENLDYDYKVESSISHHILRYLPFIKKIPSKTIFHSSYYRIALQKDVINIVTVHDFTYEYFRGGLAKYVHVLQKGIAIKRSAGTKIVPIGSTCLIGLILNLPLSLAVLSPYL